MVEKWRRMTEGWFCSGFVSTRRLAEECCQIRSCPSVWGFKVWSAGYRNAVITLLMTLKSSHFSSWKLFFSSSSFNRAAAENWSTAAAAAMRDEWCNRGLWLWNRVKWLVACGFHTSIIKSDFIQNSANEKYQEMLSSHNLCPISFRNSRVEVCYSRRPESPVWSIIDHREANSANSMKKQQELHIIIYLLNLY